MKIDELKNLYLER